MAMLSLPEGNLCHGTLTITSIHLGIRTTDILTTFFVELNIIMHAACSYSQPINNHESYMFIVLE